MLSPLDFRRAAKKALGVHSWNSDEDQQRFIPDAKTIFDVGANVGQTAKTYRLLYPAAEIYSFEPLPKTFATLRDALRDSRFHPVPLALSDQIGKGKLNIGSVSITNSLLHRDNETGQTIEIQTGTVDQFCADLGISQIDILKVDVEGAESRVFKGAQRMFSANRIRAVFCEVYFRPVYEGMPLMWDLHNQLTRYGFTLRGMYSLYAGRSNALDFGNALYLRPEALLAGAVKGHSSSD